MVEIPNRIIFTIVALGTFGVIVTLMGQSFTGIDVSNYDIINLPDNVKSSVYLLSTVDRYKNDTLVYPHVPALVLDYSGNNTDKITVLWANYAPNVLYINRVYSGFWIFNNIEPVKPYPLPKSDIMEKYDSDTNSSVLYLSTIHKQYTFEFSHNASFVDLEDSWVNGTIDIWVGEGNDIAPNSRGVWALVTSIIFFDNPDIHPVINFMFAIPFYALFITLVFYIFSRFFEVIKPLG